MKFVFIIAFPVLLNVIEAYQYISGEPNKLSAFHKREDELPKDIYVKPVAEKEDQAKRFPPYYYPRYQCELCCNGQRLAGLFPNSVSCCGNTTFDYNTALCCQNNVVRIKPSQNSWRWQCCGKYASYDTTTQLCCAGKIFIKKSFQQCCGKKVFNPLKSVCCDDIILPRPSYDTWACCGPKTYDSSKKICVDGIIENKPCELPYPCGDEIINFANKICCDNQPVERKNKYTLCCGNKGYQSDKEICCKNKIYKYNNKKTKSCCGNKLMDFTTQKCCSDVIVDMPSGKDCANYYCCGDQLLNYLTQTALCCGDRVKEIDAKPYEYYNYQCCGSEAYNTLTQTCCEPTKTDGSIIPRPNALCCGKRTYDASVKTCCNDTLYDVGKVPLKKCCCPKNNCYYPIYGPLIKEAQQLDKNKE